MISSAALREFKEIWRAQFGEDIADGVAIDEAVNLLSMFAAAYRPIKQSDIDDYKKHYEKDGDMSFLS